MEAIPMRGPPAESISLCAIALHYHSMGVDSGPQEPLEVLTKASDVAVGDQADGEAEECFVDVVASFP
ncbi:hypothetical protein ACFYVV_37810, partial [Streptomyces tendae]|uniref:hypothetical protein n=1 Tax=Streptomyces tendae TaxID=1932 RepID=UPI003674048A